MEPLSDPGLIYTTRLGELHAELLRNADVGHNGPGLDTDEIGAWVNAHDPFGDVLRFFERP